MEIKYLGHSSFLIKTKNAKLVTDPYDSEVVGFKFPKTEADLITISHNHKDHNFTKNIVGVNGVDPLIIDMPGEFEKGGIRVFGFQSFHDKTKGSERGENILYKFEAEGISVLHCGDLGFVPEDSFIDALGEVDILMVPVGGVFTLDPEEAGQLVKKIEPQVIIPMHYNQPKLNQKSFEGLQPVSEFTKKFGVENIVPLPKLVYKKEEIEQEMKVIVLEN
jgi:L-ascorbate metabolism protein UlaG (beta-lactamase superfamily)